MTDPIISALVYHALFDYPLTAAEVHHWLVTNKPVSLAQVKAGLNKLKAAGKVKQIQQWFLVVGYGGAVLVKLRQERAKISRQKLELARRAARIIGAVPEVKFVGVTGALAMENADENDDIDLMIITAADRLWLVRPLINLLIGWFFKRRKPITSATQSTISHFANAICLNLWLDESALAIPVAQRNLYTGHELAQIRPLVNKDSMHEKLMVANEWGREYLANAWDQVNKPQDKATRLKGYKVKNSANLLNAFAYRFQLWYMRPKMTTERVTLHSAFFHPGQRAAETLSRYQALMRSL